jgi:limonene-1,2-epoxide hydrolase
MADDPIDVVQRFCAAWADGDLDAIMAFFTDDAVYHNIPIAPVEGKDAIRSTIAGFTAPLVADASAGSSGGRSAKPSSSWGVGKLEFRVDNIAGDGNVVLTERVDVFSMPGATIELPVMGTFEIRDGRIAAWRDYFDMNQFMSQMPGQG